MIDREYLRIQGKNADEKFKSLEIILRRMNRRLHKTIIGYIPPSPIFGYVEKPSDDGVILKCVFPANGNISRVCLAVSKYEGSDKVDFIIGIKTEFKNQEIKFTTRRPVVVEEVELEVKPGDFMTLSTLTPANVSGICAVLLYNIEYKSGKMHQIAADILDNLIDEEVANEGV